MSLGAVLEPLVVVTLLFGGVYVNRNTNYKLFTRRGEPAWKEKAKVKDDDDYDERGTSDEYSDGEYTPTASDPMLENGTYLGSATAAEPTWRRREVGFWKFKANVVSPNTRVFKDNFLSRLLIKLPFLVECWYWALIYWVYQLGRAIGALTLVEGTVNVARRHALQVIHLEQRLGLFWEPQIQAAFMRHEALMHWINRIYSFIHIPGTIFFLVWLYNYTTVRNRLHERQDGKPPGDRAGSPGGPALYEARRRTMAVCNLLAFIVFTAWPCMPPRLLSDPKAQGPEAAEGRTYGFHDTVHGAGGESSVWTQNKFCNQYAAMPSLHFGYSLMIGMTVALIPLNPRHSRGRAVTLPVVGATRLPSPRRLLCLALGFAYPFIILIAIVSTANHFILDAVAGAIVCGLGWRYNGMLLALLPVEDYFLWCLRIHKP